MRSYAEAEEYLGSRDKKNLRYATTVRRVGEDIVIRQHDTDIVTYKKNGDVILNTGGWMTKTTKDRLNDYMPYGYHIWQEGGVWYIDHNGSWGHSVVFENGMVMHSDGTIEGGGDGDAIKDLRRSVKKYVKEFVDAVDKGYIDPPDAGDCLICRGIIQDSYHLISHMEEEYYVPTLLMNAIVDTSIAARAWVGWKVYGYEECPFWAEIAKSQVASALRKYMYRELGLVS